MKSIIIKGQLRIQSESETEEYALSQWMSQQRDGIVWNRVSSNGFRDGIVTDIEILTPDGLFSPFDTSDKELLEFEEEFIKKGD